jgi:effector-binding domain-containing protein
MLNKVLYSIVFTLILFVSLGLFLPREVHVERSIDIQRPPVTVFTIVNSYRSFPAWSPWAERDPGALYEITGPDAGVGARLSWSGDPRLVGSGWQEITDSEPNSLVRMQMSFDQEGLASSYFQIDPLASGTRVTWGIDTDLVAGQGFVRGLLARYFGLFFDAWVGADYERGLTRLKALVEDLPPANFAGFEPEIVQVQPTDILLVSHQVNGVTGESRPDLAPAYQEIVAFMAEHDIERAAQPMAITRMHGSEAYAIEAAVPVILGDIEPVGRIQIGQSPVGRALRVVHRGPYDNLAPTYEKLAAWMAAHGLAGGRASWEQYMSNPRETPAGDRITEIYFLLPDER